MQTACIHCGAEHLLKEGQFGGHTKVQFKCSSCGKTTIVEIKRRVDSTVVMSPLPSFARANATSSNLNLPPPDPALRLPEKAKVVLSILSGPSKGERHTLTRARACGHATGRNRVSNRRQRDSREFPEEIGGLPFSSRWFVRGRFPH